MLRYEDFESLFKFWLHLGDKGTDWKFCLGNLLPRPLLEYTSMDHCIILIHLIRVKVTSTIHIQLVYLSANTAAMLENVY